MTRLIAEDCTTPTKKGAPTSQAIEVRLAEIMLDRNVSLTELSADVGITMANLSKLKRGHARAVRFSTLQAICKRLDCQPGKLLTVKGRRT